jgi:hypothetical protein
MTARIEIPKNVPSALVTSEARSAVPPAFTASASPPPGKCVGVPKPVAGLKCAARTGGVPEMV